VVFTSRPLADNERFDIRMENVAAHWAGGLALGVCTADPDTLSLPASGTNLPHSWIMSENSIYKDGQVLIEHYGTDLEDLKVLLHTFLCLGLYSEASTPRPLLTENTIFKLSMC
jgi:hypothetical protein